MILDCSSHESIKESLSSIYNTTEERLLSVLSGIECNEDTDIQYLKDEIDYLVWDEIGEPSGDVKTLWFHGTRVQEPKSFWEKGILLRSEVYVEIEDFLRNLSYGMEKYGQSRYANSFATKNDINDEGPYAFLFKSIPLLVKSKSIKSGIHDFTTAPEIVEDLSGRILGANEDQLIEKFLKNTSPCIVSFVAASRDKDLLNALLFLKLIEDGKSEPEAISIVEDNTRSFKGVKIHPNQIVDVEKLPDSI